MSEVAILPSVRSFLDGGQRVLVGRDWLAASSNTMIDVINPADGKAISAIGESAPEDVGRAVRAARAPFEDGPWATMKPNERARIIFRIAELMEARAEDLAQIETLDNGKPINYARGDVAASIGAMRYYAGWTDKIHGSTHSVSMPGDFHTYTIKEPVSVVALVVPWNFPW